MSVPMLDAVNSERVGVLTGGGFNIAAIMHDTSVEAVAGGEMFRRSTPVVFQSTRPVVVERVIIDENARSEADFSQEFWDEMANLYRAASGEHEARQFNLESVESEFQTEVIGHAHRVLSSQTDDINRSHEIWQNFIREAHWNRATDAETGNVDVMDSNTFTESDLSDQTYIPDDDYISNWGLYVYDQSTEEFNACSLWFRYETLDGYIMELPLLYDTDGAYTVLSTDPDFGEDVGENYADEELLEALESGDTDNLQGVNQRIAESLTTQKLPNRTRSIIGSATDSNPIQ